MKPAGALILAAGMSTRMGQFKPLMEFNGESMIRRVVRSLKEAGASPIFMVVGYRAQEIRMHLAGEGVRFVENPDYASSQMFDSVKIGLEEAVRVCSRILITPVDAPLLSVPVIQRVMKEDAPLVRPSYKGRPGHPVLLSAALAQVLCLYQGEGGLRQAMESLPVALADIPVEDETVYMDADTPEEFENLLKIAAERAKNR